MLGVFANTDQGATLHAAYLPSRDLLVNPLRRLTWHCPIIKRFKLVLEYTTFECLLEVETYPKDNVILEFEYRKSEPDTGDYRPPPTGDNLDLRNQWANAYDFQFRYTVYPETITACYERLFKEAEALREEEALETAEIQVAEGAENDVAGVGGVDDVD
jgi:hypothetical protein